MARARWREADKMTFLEHLEELRVVVNRTMLAAPIVVLYLLGVAVAWIFGRRRRPEDAGTLLLALGLAVDMSWRPCECSPGGSRSRIALGGRAA
jgi:hypothetical protein